MAHLIKVSDDEYATLEMEAQRQDLTVQAYLHALIESMRQPRQVYDNLDDFFRSLGVSDEEIAQSMRDADTLFPPDDEPIQRSAPTEAQPNN